MNSQIAVYALCSLLWVHCSVMADSQTRLQQLMHKMNFLKHALTQDADQQNQLNQQLADTKAQIHANHAQLATLLENMEKKQREIVTLQQVIKRNEQHQKNMQQRLGQYIRARYHMSQTHTKLWLENISHMPLKNQRLMHYYQKIIQAQTQLIQQIQHTQTELAQQHHQWNADLQTQDHSHQLALQRKAQLITLYEEQEKILHKLQQHIDH